mmetsp:Transcript_2891/g.4083  ORF Transcript_2891/g.4083 Transcript_2891/m.4083 type:complete len:88 (+) Transcript_2891:158-421(+)
MKERKSRELSMMMAHTDTAGPHSTIKRPLPNGTGSAKRAVFHAHVKFGIPLLRDMVAKPVTVRAQDKKRSVTGAPALETVVSITSKA